jgi:uncharacterized protein YndB with AHSA1/START domain
METTQNTRSAPEGEQKVVRAEREVAAPAADVFGLIADPAKQPEWDGNDNLQEAAPDQRVHEVGDVFVMTLTNGQDRANEVVEFEEGRLIAWKPSPVGEPQPGHLWRWEVEPVGEDRCRVVHTYDWTGLGDDPKRQAKARSTTSDKLMASVERLAGVAEALQA